MNDDREFLRATTDWLEAGSDRTPPKAIDAVLLAVRTTRQERVLPNPWRHFDMNTLAKALIAAAAVVAIALAWVNFGPPSSNVGGAATPTPTPTPTATPIVLAEGEFVALTPGRYAFPSRLTNPTIAITVPSGWTGHSSAVSKDYGDSGPTAPVLFAWPFDHGFKDPCTDHTAVLPAAGSGAAGLLGVIAAQPGIDAGTIMDVTVAGHAGKYVDYTVTTDPATCGNGHDGFWIWGGCSPPVTTGCETYGTGDARWGAGLNNRERVYAIDVAGKTYTFFTSQPADLQAGDRTELQQVIDSIAFEPTP
jgi:hypothetical protein